MTTVRYCFSTLLIPIFWLFSTYRFENIHNCCSFQLIMNQAFFVSSLWSHFVPRGKGRVLTRSSPWSSCLPCCYCWGLVAPRRGLCSPAITKVGRTRLELGPLPLPLPMLRADWFRWRVFVSYTIVVLYARWYYITVLQKERVVATRKLDFRKTNFMITNNSTTSARHHSHAVVICLADWSLVVRRWGLMRPSRSQDGYTLLCLMSYVLCSLCSCI